MTSPVHHLELWTANFTATAASFDWLLSAAGWSAASDPEWPQGRIWNHPTGIYLVLEQSPDVTGPHRRTHAGLNHLALRIPDRERLDILRRDCVAHGWRELFGELYPHAGGPSHTALFVENDEGFEVELVAG